MKNIPIFEPDLSGNERKYLLDCIDTNWISSQGKYITEFEKSLAEYHNVNYCIATSNCTTALHLAMKALGLGEGDEIICPDLTFIAPANMILLSCAELKLVDIDPNTLALDVNLLEKSITPKTKAIIVVHQFGHAAPMDEIMAIAKKYSLKVIEDNAESIGAKYKGKLLGTFGDITCFSFFGNKVITCGEGGALITNNRELAVRCKELRDHGMSSQKKYLHIDLGYNYRMTNMQAAIGLAQMERLNEILAIRKKQMDLYYNLLKNIPQLKLRSYASWCDPVHWLITITLDEQYNRDEFLKYMYENGVECRQMINPVHQAIHLVASYHDNEFPNSVSISNQSAHLPSSTSLTEQEIELVCNTVKSFFK
jgi:perosamine synthetase